MARFLTYLGHNEVWLFPLLHMRKFNYMHTFPFGLSYPSNGRIHVRKKTRGLGSSPDCSMTLDKLSPLYRLPFSHQEDALDEVISSLQL